MNILLINPVIRADKEPNIPPIGIAYVAQVLWNQGYGVEVLDINAHRYSDGSVESAIMSSYSDIFAIGGMITTYQEIEKLSEMVHKHHPEKPLLVGGSITSSIPEILQKEIPYATLIIGEGEVATAHAIRDYEYGFLKDVYQSPPIECLDTIPVPDYNRIFGKETMEIYAKNPVGGVNVRKWIDGKPVDGGRSMPLIGGRGCPFNCRFCSSDFLGLKPRYRSIDGLIAEIVWLKENFGVDYVHFCDDLFTNNNQRVVDFCDELMKCNLDLMWGCACRVDLTDMETFEMMRDARCIQIGTGVESFSQDIQYRMGKRMDVEKVKKNLIFAKDIMPATSYTLIIGFPGEDELSLKETSKAIKEVGFGPEQVFFATPYPKTWLYDYAIRNGYIKNELEYIKSLSEQSDFRINFTGLDDEVLKKWRGDLLG